eukprot:2117433-Pyramimonas_sp.AAC.1
MSSGSPSSWPSGYHRMPPCLSIQMLGPHRVPACGPEQQDDAAHDPAPLLPALRLYGVEGSEVDLGPSLARLRPDAWAPVPQVEPSLGLSLGDGLLGVGPFQCRE